MLFYYCSIVLFASIFYIMFHPKKTPSQILSDILFEAHFQITGAGGLLDDMVQKRRNKLVDLPVKTNQIAVVTGGARGIGQEVVKKLLDCNMTVIIGVRNPNSAVKMIEPLEKKSNVVIFQLDVSSLPSIKNFCEQVNSKFPALNLLVNNAGIMFGDFKLTAEGFENQFATNYLGHFYLTHLLLPSLKRGSRQCDTMSRIVNVTSCAHFPGKVYFDDINMKKVYSPSKAYAQSKIAQIMFTRYLDKSLTENKDEVLCFAVHPGIVNTDLFEKTYHRKYFPVLMDTFFKTTEKGAVSVLYACLSPELEDKGGLYVSNCGEGCSNSFSKNNHYQEELFKISCDMVGVKVEQYGMSIEHGL